jgi:hypothetical protein
MVMIGEAFNENEYYRIGYDINKTDSTITHGVIQPLLLQ